MRKRSAARQAPSRKLPEPIYPKDRKPIVTLKDARDFLTSLPHEFGTLPEWQRAIEALIAAEKGGSVQSAHDALWNAIFIRAMYDVKRLKPPKH